MVLLQAPAFLQRACVVICAVAAFISQLRSIASPVNPTAVPAVGDYELRIISPTVLELALVTTKEPDPAPVSTWNFVGPNFALTLPPLSGFQILANGVQIPVNQVGFRRRPIYAPLKTRDLRIGNSIFLQLSVPLVNGQSISVRNPDGSIWSSSMLFTNVVDPLRISPAIHVNQVGYAPNEPKKAMVGYYLGSMGELNIGSPSFNLLDASSGQVRHTGTLIRRGEVGYTYSPAPYQNVFEADFSAFTAAGEYVLQVPGLGISHRFQIHEGTTAVFARTLALGLYHQRCGTDNIQPYTRHEHGVCHFAPAEIPGIANSFVNSALASMSSDYANEPLHTAPQLKSLASSLYPFVNQGSVDVRGGHHDAGDYSKYTINSAALIHHLVFAADAFPGVAAMDNLGIPESNDGKSDFLQEAKWEADFLAKMQDADGAFYFLVYPRTREYEDNVLPDSGDLQLVFPKTTSVTAAAVGALAEIASSPTFKAQFPLEAANYLEKARRGWTFLSGAISKYGKNGSYQKITHYGNEFMHNDELAWAAAAMFAATGEPGFHNQLKAWYDPSDSNTRRWTWWRLFEGYGCAARAYAFAARSGRLSSVALDSSYLAKCESEIIAAGDDIARFAQQSAYGTSFPDLNKAYRSAGWYFSSERAFELATARQLVSKPSYKEALFSNMNYEGGCNPLNLPFITGMGARAWRDIVHQYAQNDYQVLPPAGILLGNIQAGFAYLENYKQSLGQLCYPPDGAATAPYPFYDRWGDSFNTTTEFVVVDLARSLGTYASLMAQSGMAAAPYSRTAAFISGLPATVPAQHSITTAFSAPGVDLTGARITWEARDQEPCIGTTFTFAAKNPGSQWVEAEALLPDGRRLVCKTNFTASYAVTVAPNPYRSSPVNSTTEMAALYHLDGNLADATGKNAALSLAGNARFDDLNLGWMSSRSGKAIRFDDLGDKATVTISAPSLCASDTSEISVEAMVFIEGYKGWNRTSAQLMGLERSWNASLKWFEDTYSGAHVSGGMSFDCTGATLGSALPAGKWHHLQISLSNSGYSLRVNGAVVASASAADLALWNGGSAQLELGNFSGWMDEIVVRNKRGAATPVVTAPAVPSNFQAQPVSNSQVLLSWNDLATDEQGYRLYKSTNGTDFIQCATMKPNATSCSLGALSTDTAYTFAIKSFNSSAESEAAFASARTLTPPPAMPYNVAAKSTNGVLLLTWNPGAYAQAYNIKRSESPLGPFAVIASNVTSTSYLDSSVTVGVGYYYKIVSTAGVYQSRDSKMLVATVTSPTANIRHTGDNTTRQGSWNGVLGLEGYWLAGDAQLLPSYVTMNVPGKSDWFWEYLTDDVRGLQRPNSSVRFAGCSFASPGFDVNLKFKDAQYHRVSFYILDWDRAQRVQKVELIDGVTGRVLKARTVTSTSDGVYLEYYLQGEIKVRFTGLQGPNAVLSGIFFDRAN